MGIAANESAPSLTRIPALDGLRGVAILMVMMHHLSAQPHLVQGLSNALFNLRYSGWTGVDLFFVLSGFLITGILLDAKGAPRYFSSFYARRVLRIFPLYYATIALWAAYQIYEQAPATVILGRLAWLSCFSVNIANAVNHTYYFVVSGVSLDHFWSLGIEEQFYLIWPAVVLMASTRWLRIICIGCIIEAAAFRTLEHGYFVTTLLLPARIDSLAMGALLSIELREHPRLIERLAIPLVVAGFPFVLATFGTQLVYTALSVFFGATVAAALVTPMAKVFEPAPLRQLGKVSYGLYVLHMPLLPLIKPYLRELPGPPMVARIVAIAIFYAVAWTSWRFLEKPMLSLKRRFPRAKRPSVADDADLQSQTAIAPPGLITLEKAS